MNYIEAPFAEELIARMVSNDGRLELGVYPVMFGFRVRAREINNLYDCLVDYCCADDFPLLAATYACTLRILEGQPEGVCAEELKALFPAWKHRPISQDPCFGSLSSLALAYPLPEELASYFKSLSVRLASEIICYQENREPELTKLLRAQA